MFESKRLRLLVKYVNKNKELILVVLWYLTIQLGIEYPHVTKYTEELGFSIIYSTREHRFKISKTGKKSQFV